MWLLQGGDMSFELRLPSTLPSSFVDYVIMSSVPPHNHPLTTNMPFLGAWGVQDTCKALSMEDRERMESAFHPRSLVHVPSASLRESADLCRSLALKCSPSPPRP